jgi:hypothetical protein
MGSSSVGCITRMRPGSPAAAADCSEERRVVPCTTAALEPALHALLDIRDAAVVVHRRHPTCKLTSTDTMSNTIQPTHTELLRCSSSVVTLHPSWTTAEFSRDDTTLNPTTQSNHRAGGKEERYMSLQSPNRACSSPLYAGMMPHRNTATTYPVGRAPQGGKPNITPGPVAQHSTTTQRSAPCQPARQP